VGADTRCAVARAGAVLVPHLIAVRPVVQRCSE